MSTWIVSALVHYDIEGSAKTNWGHRSQVYICDTAQEAIACLREAVAKEKPARTIDSIAVSRVMDAFIREAYEDLMGEES